MIEFALFAIFLFLLVGWLLKPDGNIVTGALNMKGIEPCPPHKWIYVKVTDPIDRVVRERMMCDKCKNPPGIG